MRSAIYGYDQCCELFGTKGLVTVNNVPQWGTTTASTSTAHHMTLQKTIKKAGSAKMEVPSLAGLKYRLS